MLVVFMELFAAPISEAVSVVDGPANSYRVCEEVGRYAPASVGPLAVNESGLAGSLDRVGAPPVLSGTAKMMYQGSGAPAPPKFQTPNSVNGIGFGCRPHVGAQAADGSKTPTLGSIICPKAQMDSPNSNTGNSFKLRFMDTSSSWAVRSSRCIRAQKLTKVTIRLRRKAISTTHAKPMDKAN